MLNQTDTEKLPTTERSALKVPGRSIASAPDDAVRAIRLLVDVRDGLELSSRPPGDLVIITRQANDSYLNNLAIVAKIIRQMAERL